MTGNPRWCPSCSAPCTWKIRHFARWQVSSLFTIWATRAFFRRKSCPCWCCPGIYLLLPDSNSTAMLIFSKARWLFPTLSLPSVANIARKFRPQNTDSVWKVSCAPAQPPLLGSSMAWITTSGVRKTTSSLSPAIRPRTLAARPSANRICWMHLRWLPRILTCRWLALCPVLPHKKVLT